MLVYVYEESMADSRGMERDSILGLVTVYVYEEEIADFRESFLPREDYYGGLVPVYVHEESIRICLRSSSNSPESAVP